MSGEVWEWELRLLRATIGGEPLATARIDSPADGHNALLQLAIEGKYREIFDLATEAGILISGGAVRVGDPAAFEALEGHLISTWSTALQFEDLGCAVKLFAVGVAALLLFVQANVTGPEHDTSQPQCSLVQNGAQCEHHLPGKASSVSGPAACASNERWAERQLAVDSEDLFAKCQLPQYLLLARRVLVDLLQLNRRASAQAALKQVQSPGLAEDEEVEGSKESRTIQCGESEYQLATLEEMIDPSRAKSFVESALPSWFWWAARAVAIHQRLLSRKSATLRTELVALTDDTMKIFNVTNRERVPPVVRAAALLEAGLWELQYRHIEAAKAFLSHAEAALGLVVDLSGAMGVRTAHQQEAKAQLFVKVQHTHEA
ncbi:unnamed protein product [Ostreobium quekettii]|uniref:Uncharacterized protein n=1 Tax=Ostreobium quekettii TaxID=121088 RepID=A0A8S1J2Q7_9CHLO|nr:unnamed protein product [Ostreobium quekettii]|eukprot:evm.model.scf_312.4 EVM.evm.TU.scf_312.4   scf_312:52007-55133(+)